MARKVSLRLHYDQWSDLVALLALALLVSGSLGYLAWGRQVVSAAGPQAPGAVSLGLRGYYLTTGTYNGSQADGTDGNGAGVCTNGYHFASLWEVLDPSNLKYNTNLGYVTDDSGQGPPTTAQTYAWVRTGYDGNTGGVAGQANCNAWASASGSDVGTYVRLSSDWTNPATQDIHVWDASLGYCSNTLRVWCVADRVGERIYLPLVMSNFS